MLAANVLFLGVATQAWAGQTWTEQVRVAATAYFDGKALTAQRDLEALLPKAATPAERLEALDALLTVCVHARSEACLLEHAPAYAEAAGEVAATDPASKPMLARKALNYLDQARFTARSAETTRADLAHPVWASGETGDPAFDIGRQVLVSNMLLSLDEPVAASRAVDDLLARIAAVKTPQAARFTLAAALADAIWTLVDLGETERAFGVLKASGTFIDGGLPPLSVDAVAFHVAAAQVMQEMGSPAASLPLLDAAIATAGRIEMEPQTRA